MLELRPLIDTTTAKKKIKNVFLSSARISYALFFFLMPSLARLIQTLEDKGASLVLSTEQWTASQHTVHQGEG